MESVRQVEHLRGLLEFDEWVLDDTLKRIEILRALLSSNPQMASEVYPYLFHKYYRETTLETLKRSHEAVLERPLSSDVDNA